MDFHYIDAIDLPSDPNGSMGKVRRELTKVYNTNRLAPDKLKLLKKTLQFIIYEINAGEKRRVLTKEELTSKKNQHKIDTIDQPKKVLKPKPKSKLSTSPVRGRKNQRAAKRTKTGK